MTRSADPKVEKSIAIPKSLVDKTEPLLTAPLTQRLEHGGWSRLVSYLLKKYHDDLASGKERLPNMLDF